MTEFKGGQSWGGGGGGAMMKSLMGVGVSQTFFHIVI